jgi:hypothetical protein
MSKTKTTFYKKEGRKYVPVYEYDQELVDSFPKGNHLVMCYPNGQSRRFNIDPALAPMIAAGRYAEDKMLEAINQASKGHLSERVLTKEEKEAWENLGKVFGDRLLTITYPSHYSIVQAGLQALQEEAEKLLQNHSVREQYEKFLMVCKLTQEEER